MLAFSILAVAAAILYVGRHLMAGLEDIQAALTEQGDALTTTITTELGDIATAIENAGHQNGGATEEQLQAIAAQIRERTASYVSAISAMVTLPEPPASPRR